MGGAALAPTPVGGGDQGTVGEALQRGFVDVERTRELFAVVEAHIGDDCDAVRDDRLAVESIFMRDAQQRMTEPDRPAAPGPHAIRARMPHGADLAFDIGLAQRSAIEPQDPRQRAQEL